MAKNDPDGNYKSTHNFSLDEADTFRDRAAVIEQKYHVRLRQALLALAKAALNQQMKDQEAQQKRGLSSASIGASGLQGAGARRRAAYAAYENEKGFADASHQLMVQATAQDVEQERLARAAQHANNFRDLLAGRYA